MRKFPFVVIGMLLRLPCAHAQSPLGWSVYRGEDGAIVDFPLGIFAVSYTHLTLPTNREV